jgi:Ni,Fe-hydrogenase I small subunit
MSVTLIIDGSISAGAVGVSEILPDKTVVNLPGCPPNPYNFLSVVLQFLRVL